MTRNLNALTEFWQSRLAEDHPHLSKNTQIAIIAWLLGENKEDLEELTPEKLEIIQRGLDYRYRLLTQRYLNTSPLMAYRRLINRLGSVMVLRHKIQTWVALSRDRQRVVSDVLQEVIQEMLNSDRYIQSQMAWIAQCTPNENLRNILLFASLEEYCLRPIRNQPLLVYRFVNYLRASQRGGMTQVPQQQMIHLVSEEKTRDDATSKVSLLDQLAISSYQDSQQEQDQQMLRLKVQGEFETYLAEKVGKEAQKWLSLHISGKSSQDIAEILNLPIKQVYRLREKVTYHATKVFSVKKQPELVESWLG